jgi:general secretion pathway protein D
VNRKQILTSLATIMIFTNGCVNNPGETKLQAHDDLKMVSVPKSYLSRDQRDISVTESSPSQTDSSRGGQLAGSDSKQKVRDLEAIQWGESQLRSGDVLSAMFSGVKKFGASAEKMPLEGFIHYVFSDLLGVNYVLGEGVVPQGNSQAEKISLDLQNLVSARDLFDLSSDILINRGLHIKYGSETFYIYRPDGDGGASELVVGVGRNDIDVPNTSKTILQIVPLKFGVKLSVERTLISVVKAKITPDYEQSSLFVTGGRQEILRALDLIEILDKPAARGKYVGLIGLTYIEPGDFSRQIALLLENEGIDASIGKPASRNVVMVPLEKRGAVVIFAANELLLDRVRYWSGLVDKPGDGSNEQYFIYSPKHARAIDLGESVSALIGVAGAGFNPGQNVSSGQSTGNAPAPSRVAGINNGKIRMVVDERSNALVFYTTGSEYRALTPLLEKLDTMPKQVLLDITIAEVSLKDEFKFGVEWAVQRGEVQLTTQGAFGATAIGGVGVSIAGSEGPLDASFLKTNSLVNILSNPTIMVRDGVTANIAVGSDISVVGETTQDPINGERQTTAAEYRKTGVDVTVTPTVNARGIVVMEINQKISNTVPSTSGSAGNPDIFERSIKTEVVAESGQTIMLGGLISGNYSKGDTGVPGFASIPLLGKLFKSESDSSDRTELVMLITPKVLDDLGEWREFSEEFRSELKFINLQ